MKTNIMARDLEKVRANKRRWYAKNRERALEQSRNRDPQKRKEYMRQWSARNRQKLRENSRKYAMNNKDKIKESNHSWYERNKELIREVQRVYAKNHRDQINTTYQRYRARKLNANINDLTTKEWQSIKKYYGYRCAYCGKKLKHLTQDHITPLSKGGSHTTSNVVPACQPCNSRKATNAPLRPVQPLLFVLEDC